MIYGFTLLVPGQPDLTDDVLCRLLAGGCWDATFSHRDGCVWAEFGREERSCGLAMQSAVAALANVFPDSPVFAPCDMREAYRSMQMIEAFEQFHGLSSRLPSR